eukprot:TRINITY_DN5756_c0_g1_i1.p1 TRINITY_DN5756_c0_g1~~TRINITY_DN5756_c0_g1_i1.p1  ORF type:complete len:258 (-),score=60.02 TRINITY_DN5756_c0_g1_i1:128-901(-)
MSRPGLSRADDLKRLHSVPLPQSVHNLPNELQEVKGVKKDGKDLLIKVLVIGDVGTGKTSIIGRYAHGVFSQRYKATIGVDFAWKAVNWSDDLTIRLQLWDIAGQERFGQMTRVYYKDALGVFIVYDVTRPNTFDAVSKWKDDVNKKVTFLGTDDPIPTVVLANKVDLVEKEGREQTPSDLDSFCDEQGILKWFETSAKENIGIDAATQFLIKKILEKMAQVPKEEPVEEKKESFQLDKKGPPTPEANKQNCACWYF